MIKMYECIIYLTLVFICSSVCSSKLPSFITPCRRDLDNEAFSECALKEARRIQKEFSKGIPELGVEPLDPLNIGRLEISASTLSIQQKNVIVKGASKLEIKEIKLNQDNMNGKIVAFGNLTAASDYDVVGRLLLIPITGQGKFKIKMENTEISMRFKSKLVRGEDGRDHLYIYEVKPSHSFGNVRMRMDGLFGNDKTIGDTVNQVLNENWRDLMKEFGPPSVKAVTDKTIGILNSFYAKVPNEDLHAST